MSNVTWSNYNRFDDVYLSLDGVSNSDESQFLIQRVFESLNGKEGWVHQPRDSMRGLVGAFALDLLRLRSLGRDIWLYRSFHAPSFLGQAVGYKAFKKVFDAFVLLGFLEIKHDLNRQFVSGSGKTDAKRFRATARFFELALSCGITPSNFRSHFTRQAAIPAITDPIRVRAAKKGDWRNPQRGELLPVDLAEPVVIDLIGQMNRLNAFFARQDIKGATALGFYRLFNEGDRPRFAFNKGGRLYAFGDYQRIDKKRKRPFIRISGEPVVEVDVAASHPFLYHAMRGVPLLPGIDPYLQCGIDRRSVAKRFINMTLGNGKPIPRWPDEAKASYLEGDLGIQLGEGEEYTKDQLSWLQRDYPIGKIRKAVLASFPLLGAIPESGIGWADLQYRESLGLIATVETLAYQYGICALPLHDSVIVPVSAKEIAAKVMKECFLKHAGVSIGTKVK